MTGANSRISPVRRRVNAPRERQRYFGVNLITLPSL